ncbi:MAG: 2,3-bisphosphoglycerate-dependent phosphoglycerate mutase [Chloroflexota bacterium]|nr:2,3-bisphosphoglycerate-dependent phosphoglycerate mutase [Chloroflexota bacterium]
MRSLEATFLIGVEGVTVIWLVRHGDCYEGMAEGSDPPLSPLGRTQASRLADRVQRAGASVFYASPMRRAVETAHIIGGDDVHEDERLVEIDLELGDDSTLHFKESRASVIDRMRSANEDIVAAHPGEHVVVVTHGIALMAYISDVLHLEPGQMRLLPFYTSVSVVRALGKVRMVGTIADTAHLE